MNIRGRRFITFGGGAAGYDFGVSVEPMDERILEALAAGRVVAFPTESSYGLAARLDRPEACAQIAVMKDREENSPFPVIAGSTEAARDLAASWSSVAALLAEKHWPGPLTLVLPARAGLPREVLGPGGTIGVRVSPHPVASRLAQAAGPITATSANRRGASPALTADEVRVAFDAEDIDVIDGGACVGGAPSTVVAVTAEGLRVLRPGAIEIEELEWRNLD